MLGASIHSAMASLPESKNIIPRARVAPGPVMSMLIVSPSRTFDIMWRYCGTQQCQRDIQVEEIKEFARAIGYPGLIPREGKGTI